MRAVTQGGNAANCEFVTFAAGTVLTRIGYIDAPSSQMRFDYATNFTQAVGQSAVTIDKSTTTTDIYVQDGYLCCTFSGINFGSGKQRLSQAVQIILFDWG